MHTESYVYQNGVLDEGLTFCAPSLPVTRSIKSESFMDNVQFPFKPVNTHTEYEPLRKFSKTGRVPVPLVTEPGADLRSTSHSCTLPSEPLILKRKLPFIFFAKVGPSCTVAR